MQQQIEEQEIILVRGSEEHREYIKHQAGWLKVIVNNVEDWLAISGRTLLLVFILYTTVKAGMTLVQREMPWWLDIVMLAFQVCGLEGSIPGLARLREALVAKNTPTAKEDAETIKSAIHSARLLNMLTGVEILLVAYSSHTFNISGVSINIAEVSKLYGYALLLFRLWKITSFITAMARMEVKKPKIISQAEYERTHTPAIPQADVHELIAKAIENVTSEQAKVNQHLLAALEEVKTTLALPPAIDFDALTQGVMTHLQAQFDAWKKEQMTLRQAQEIPQLDAPKSAPQHTSKNDTSKRNDASKKILTLRQPSAANTDKKATIRSLLDEDSSLSSYKLATLANCSEPTARRIKNEYIDTSKSVRHDASV